MTYFHRSLLLLYHIPLERCCVHNAPPVVTNSSCLPPGRCKANVLLAKVCLHCTKPGQVWLGLPNGRFQSGGSLRITAATAPWCMVLLLSAAGNMSKEPQTSVSDQVGERNGSVPRL